MLEHDAFRINPTDVWGTTSLLDWQRQEIERLRAALAEAQEPLGEEFERVLDENADKLYISD